LLDGQGQLGGKLPDKGQGVIKAPFPNPSRVNRHSYQTIHSGIAEFPLKGLCEKLGKRTIQATAAAKLVLSQEGSQFSLVGTPGRGLIERVALDPAVGAGISEAPQISGDWDSTKRTCRKPVSPQLRHAKAAKRPTVRFNGPLPAKDTRLRK
jgi:hypothetical protein